MFDLNNSIFDLVYNDQKILVSEKAKYNHSIQENVYLCTDVKTNVNFYLPESWFENNIELGKEYIVMFISETSTYKVISL